MAFLNNSGDIILDAVLTDTGRFRLAKGDGSFKIAKFALADDEIDYKLYQNANYSADGSAATGAHSSGSAYYDLNILKTPILEAFTNNTSLMKHKLISIPRTNILYLPTLKLNALDGAKPVLGEPLQTVNSTYYVSVDEITENTDHLGGLGNITDFMKGFAGSTNCIRVDQGLDTTEIPPSVDIPGDLKETQYIVEIDNRLGVLRQPGSNTNATPSFIDDDNIASYYFTAGTDTAYITDVPTDKTGKSIPKEDVISGPRGTTINFSIGASIQLQTSTFLFTQLGSVEANLHGTVDYYTIDTIVRVTAATMGRSIDIPVRFIKWKTDTA